MEICAWHFTYSDLYAFCSLPEKAVNSLIAVTAVLIFSEQIVPIEILKICIDYALRIKTCIFSNGIFNDFFHI